MSCFDEMLFPSEVIFCQVKRHWIVGIIPGTGSVILGFSSLTLFFMAHRWVEGLEGQVAAVLFPALYMIWAAILAAIAFLVIYSRQLLLTDRRILIQYGSVFSRVRQIQLDRLELATATQGRVAKLLNYGTVCLVAGGATITLPWISRARTFAHRAESARYAYTLQELELFAGRSGRLVTMQ